MLYSKYCQLESNKKYFHGLFILLPNRFPKNNKNNSKKKQIFMFRIQSEIIFCKKCVEIIGMISKESLELC